MEPVRVAIFTDDRLLREGIRCILTAEANLAVRDRLPESGEPQPAVTLLDARIEGALETCSALRLSLRTCVILMEAPEDDAWGLEALAAGARGILPRRAGRDELLGAIRVVGQGLIWAPRRLVVARLDQLSQFPPSPRLPGPNLEQRLSRREREVFREAASGLGNKELADRLSISEATVKVHLTHIFQKLGLNGRAELAAAYHGLLPGKPSARPQTAAAVPSPQTREGSLSALRSRLRLKA